MCKCGIYAHVYLYGICMWYVFCVHICVDACGMCVYVVFMHVYTYMMHECGMFSLGDMCTFMWYVSIFDVCVCV